MKLCDKTLRRIYRSINKRLSFESERAIAERIEWAGMSPVDAYKCGAEETHNEMIRRIKAIQLLEGPELRPNPPATE